MSEYEYTDKEGNRMRAITCLGGKLYFSEEAFHKHWEKAEEVAKAIESQFSNDTFGSAMIRLEKEHSRVIRVGGHKYTIFYDYQKYHYIINR
ncbi:MAG: hypothetical protein V1898_01995 [Patescibacteria group bacterium]